MRYVFAYAGAAVVMAVLDGLWLVLTSSRLYRPVIGELMADKPSVAPAAAFYAIYLLGIVVLAIAPALREGSLVRALVSGAVLGMVAYATYDLTNQATLKTWATHLTVIDIAWGTFMTAAAALAGYLLARKLS